MIADTYSTMIAMQAYLSGALSRRALEQRIGRDAARELMRDAARAAESATESDARTIVNTY